MFRSLLLGFIQAHFRNTQERGTVMQEPARLTVKAMMNTP
jgi:hypothetical protein